MLVERVIAGVLVDVATLPEKPFADTTETDITVPDPLRVTCEKVFGPDLTIAAPVFVGKFIRFVRPFVSAVVDCSPLTLRCDIVVV